MKKKKMTQERKQATNGKRSSGYEKKSPKKKQKQSLQLIFKTQNEKFPEDEMRMTRNIPKSITSSSRDWLAGCMDGDEMR